MKNQKKFNELTISQQCLLIGQVARQYDDGNTVQKIAEDLNRPYELIHEVLGIILVARHPKKYN